VIFTDSCDGGVIQEFSDTNCGTPAGIVPLAAAGDCIVRGSRSIHLRCTTDVDPGAASNLVMLKYDQCSLTSPQFK
jgi:hypothetical protein